ncbi:MAG TPA: imidazolonepropionase, partial [Streptosporangiaceae bacterium]|nr:imidazolonepropionase [Streptosporangiaceae bacterium]
MSLVSTLLTNIGELVTNARDGRDTGGVPAGPGPFAAIADAALVIEGGRVAWTGPARHAPAADHAADLGGRAVLPGFVDSHAHLVFAGERSAEFAARMAGEQYAAGGIRTTVAATRAATDEQLRDNLHQLAQEMLAQGTTTLECKSGYGLTVADERRSVTLAAEVTPEVTFLGAHVVPPEFAGDPARYTDLVRGPMLAACAPHARWVDVFCEQGAFGADEARAVLTAGLAAGL